MTADFAPPPGADAAEPAPDGYNALGVEHWTQVVDSLRVAYTSSGRPETAEGATIVGPLLPCPDCGVGTYAHRYADGEIVAKHLRAVYARFTDDERVDIRLDSEVHVCAAGGAR